MYQVFFNGYPLYDPRDPELMIREPDIHLAVAEAGSVAFTIDRGHPYADKITRLKGVLDLRADGLSIYKGRVIKDTQDFNLSREITTEGLMACLNDSIIPPFNFPDDFLGGHDYQEAAESGNVVQFFLGWLLDQHNSQVGAAQQIQLGSVTVRDPNNYISRSSSEYLPTLEVIRAKLEDLLGGYLLIDYSGTTPVLNYYEELPLTNTQVVEYGENLLDLMSELNSADTYTAILPVGADGLTIESLPDGEIRPGVIKAGRIIYSTAAEDACGGRITRKVAWDDVTLAENLQTKAVARLTGEGIMTSHTVQVTAADLGGYTGDSSTVAVAGEAVAGKAIVGTASAWISKFMVGRHVRLQSTPHGFGVTFPLMELDPDIFDPGNTEITLGATVMTASDISNKNQSQMQDRLDGQQIQINDQQSGLADLTQSVTTQITEAIQTCQSIIFSALESYVETSNFEEYRETVASQLAILADEISINLTKTTEQIEQVNGDLQSKYESITKYFRFTADGLYIGESGNEVLLRLDNDIVQFLRANVPELYMDEKGVHAEELHARAIHIGDYILQREDDGRISLKKAVTA